MLDAERPTTDATVKGILQQLRVLAKQAIGIEPVVRAVRNSTLEFHGSADGGWCIKANSLDAKAIVVDVGLGEDASFPLSLISKYGCTVHGFDPTPRAIRYVRGLSNERLRLYEFGIGAVSGPVKFYLPTEAAHVSGAIEREAHLGAQSIEVQLRTIGQILEMIGESHIDLLKLDVEGAEYDVFGSDEFRRCAPAIDQICVEFHHRWKSRGTRSTLAAVRRLRELGFECAWRSRTTNEEFTFVRSNGANRSHGARPLNSPA